MKSYIQPAVRIVSLETEDGILAESGTLNAHNKVVSGSGDGIGDQFTNKQETIWEDTEGSIWK